ncbi:MAG: aminoacetone oxidase family FAD-binding enzyme [Clostridiales bacterium]|nr:aminoacetone oxidase family FAD-binding enzyme [Clostridiales bacterium]
MTRHTAKNNYNTIIIGGGASGLAAACVCAMSGLPFLLVEKENKLGRKLLATGNGRCNLMNVGPAVYFGETAFAHQVLSRCGVSEVSAFFKSLGLAFFEEEGGRVYPHTRQALTVLDCLLTRIAAFKGATVRTCLEVSDIQHHKDGFDITTTNRERFIAPTLILATGSPAAPKLGGSGRVTELAGRLGHHHLPFSPALCALRTQTGAIQGLNGLRVPAYLTLYHDDHPVCAAAGELLYTAYGVSGLCAMQLARDAQSGLAQGKHVSVGIDLSPLLGTRPVLMRRLRLDELTPKENRQAINKLLHTRRQTLGEAFLYTGLLPHQLMGILSQMPLQPAVDWLCDLRLRVSGTQGFEQAQVASGGIACSEVDPANMRSRVLKGLYLCGEMLNVDGDTGGHNLLFAWATGILAARDILQKQ